MLNIEELSPEEILEIEAGKERDALTIMKRIIKYLDERYGPDSVDGFFIENQHALLNNWCEELEEIDNVN
jgi:hypothetical protein